MVIVNRNSTNCCKIDRTESDLDRCYVSEVLMKPLAETVLEVLSLGGSRSHGRRQACSGEFIRQNCQS
jgi:hypothetical protein